MIPKRTLGGTDMAVSVIGLGTVKIGRNQQVHYPAGFELPTDKAILNLLACAKELGINLLDTAPAYGSSEERLGSLLKNDRAEWILSTKVGEEFVNGASHFDFSAAAIRHSVERSLKRLKTDYLDIVLVHSNGEDKTLIEERDVFATLAELKTAGLIRSFGMSTKTVEGGLMAVNHSDIVMVTHNPTYTAEQSVITYAHQKHKGIFIKKALASGHLQKISEQGDPVALAMQCIFQEPGVSSVIVGTLNPDHLKQNVLSAEPFVR
jgi:aryl-alcohol dehydrogenase-like predicted oxidoreductase